MVTNLNDDQFEGIFQKNRESDQIQPNPQVWKSLESKLELDQNKRKSFIYRNWAIAASILVLVTLGLMFSIYLDNANHDTFASNGSDTTIFMEDLGTAEVHFIELENIAKLYRAYSELGAKADISIDN